MYPTNPELMFEICKLAHNKWDSRMDKAQREAVKWFRTECLAYVTDIDPHQFIAKRGEVFRHDIHVSTRPDRAMDHMWTFRYGRKAYEFVMVSMPYREALPINQPVEAKAFNGRRMHVTDLEVVMLPTEWSWWYPGRTIIFTISLPGVVRYIGQGEPTGELG